MSKLGHTVIEDFAKEATKLLRVIRLIPEVESLLPVKFPQPSKVKAGRKPFDLILEWRTANNQVSASLKSKIAQLLGLEADTWKIGYSGWYRNQWEVMSGKSTVARIELKVHDHTRYTQWED